jgi:dienelactone hydrolase
MRSGDRTLATGTPVDRRAFLITTVVGLAGTRLSQAQSAITRPVVSEKACPLETIYPVAADGHRGLAVLRKPPGAGPFPVIVWFHGDITIRPLARLEETARDLATGSRFLAAGYVFVAPTYRSRDVDPQTTDSVEDALAVVEYLGKLPFVDRQSIVVGGCSGGGDLALQVAARTNVCAVVAEEPASVLMSGVFNNSTPKRGERYTPEDSMFMLEDGRRYYTPELQRTFRAKLAKINAPILIVQGDVDRREGPINRFNADVLIPELRASSRQFDVQTYPGQAHCFCSASGLPRPGGMAAPASWPAAALKAFQDIDAFCRRHVRTAPVAFDREHVTYTAVRTGNNLEVVSPRSRSRQWQS